MSEFSFYQLVNTLPYIRVDDQLFQSDREMMDFFIRESWTHKHLLGSLNYQELVWEPAEQYFVTAMFCSH